ncbi:MAG: hypothetical protein JJU20_01280 [Opitutales bacterium]|nr:hypothetical protein [Opitutales bacterium]
MQTLGKWYLAYGSFLILCGIAGYLSNPEAAQTALMSGSVFGLLSMLWGLLFLRGYAWAWWLALIITTMLVGAFSWRAIVGWQETMAGEPKMFAASLISLMWLASVVSIWKLFRHRR